MQLMPQQQQQQHELHRTQATNIGVAISSYVIIPSHVGRFIFIGVVDI